jgi:hypothetical protein
VEALTPGTRSCTRRATTAGLMWPSAAITSATMARRCGVMRRPRDRSSSSTVSVEPAMRPV